MNNQSFEHILQEAKQVEFQAKFNKVNKKLWGWISILISFQILGFIVFSGYFDLYNLMVGFIILLFILPLTIGSLSMLFSIIPFMDWRFEDRVYRAFLILLLITESIITLLLMFSVLASILMVA